MNKPGLVYHETSKKHFSTEENYVLQLLFLVEGETLGFVDI